MIVTCPDCATRYDVEDSAFSSGGRAVRCHHCGCEWYQIGPAGAAAIAAPAALDAEPEPTLTPSPVPFATADHLDDGAERRVEAERLVREQAAVERAAEERARMQRAATSAAEAGAVAVGPVRRPAPPQLDRSHALSPAMIGGAHEAVSRPSSGRRLGLFATIVVGVVAAIAIIGVYQLQDSVVEVAPIATNTIAPQVESDPVDSVFAAAPSLNSGVRAGVVFVDYKYDLVERPEGPALEVWGRIANNGPETTLTPLIEIVARDAEGEALQKWYARPESESLRPGDSDRFTSRLMFPPDTIADVDLYLATP